MIKKLKAFSLVELMMILLVASLIIAALVPVVTKKHYRLPALVNHGAYMCYYKDGQLHEAKWAGKFQQQPIFDRATDNCVFVPPKKAAYFQISAIGGGGGGGDAGYKGGNWVSDTTPTDTVNPLGITKSQMITLLDLEDTPAGEIDDYINEVITYMGTLRGYANSLGSGDGGSMSYISTSDGEKCTGGWSTKTVPREEKTTYTLESSDSGCRYCLASDRKYVCDEDVVEERCDYCSPCANDCKEYKDHDCYYTQQVKVGEIEKPGVSGYQSSCGGACSPGHRTGCDEGGGCCYSGCTTPSTKEPKYEDRKVEKTCRICVDTYSESTMHESWCSRTVTSNCHWELTNCIDGGPVEEGKTCSATYDVTKTVYDKVPECNGWTDVCTLSSSVVSGGSGGSGASCTTNSIHGNLNVNADSTVTYISSTSTSSLKGTNGNTSLAGGGTHVKAESGLAVCSGGTATDCGSSPSSAYYELTGPAYSGFPGKAVAEALSASKGGGPATANGTSINACGDSYDSSPTHGVAGSNGTCAQGSAVTSSTSTSVCTGTGATGYCLYHHYAPSTADVGGKYEFYYGYDLNYLGYGGAGAPGQFKTTIVRSLKNVENLTIKVGRGGSAAAINSGRNGINGSTTTFGDVISALGGDGGKGSLKKDSERLPTYNKERHEKESLCYYYDKYMQKNDNGTYRYNTPEAINLRNKLSSSPDYCGDLVNNQNAYKFYQIAGNMVGEYPTPTGVFSTFMNVAFSNASASDLFNKFIRFGRGGTGGGVEHRCWAGRHDVVFEDAKLDASVYVDYASATPYAKAHNRYVPDNCRNQYSNIPAGPGVDGALLIKW